MGIIDENGNFNVVFFFGFEEGEYEIEVIVIDENGNSFIVMVIIVFDIILLIVNIDL